MFAGGGLFVPVARELSWCTLGELEGVTVVTKEGAPTISACQMILNTCSILMENKDIATYMEWSIDHIPNRYKLFLTTMFHVLCAMSQHELHC